MTKKDYELIARCIKHSINMQDLIERLCFELKMDNPHFDPNRFKDASRNTLELE